MASALEGARRIVVLTGAGISTASGIPDFRGPNGIYRQLGAEAERIFDIDHFMVNPSTFYGFHRRFLEMVEAVRPSFAHRFIAKLEETKDLAVITQNVDGLHQRAGSRNVIEIHGGIGENSCLTCGRTYSLGDLKAMMEEREVPLCSCGGLIKPHVVFFGEGVRDLDRCMELSRDCQVMLVVGSSLTVTPAASLPSLCKGTLAVVNRGEIYTGHVRRPIDIMIEEDIDPFFMRLAAEMGLKP